MKLIRTKMMDRYLIKFGIRIFIFCVVLFAYLFHREILVVLMTHEFTFGILGDGPNLLQVLWFIFMVMMILHLFPHDKLSMALRKEQPEQYVPVTGYSELELLRFVQQQNVRAWMVLLVWLIFNAFWGLLYLMNVLDSVDLLMLTVFYFLCDYICILIYCPFQSVIMKNKCCVNCRIYEWGHFMMFTPMLFIKDFFSWSLFFTSLVVLIRWEIIYARHPERFWSGSNQNLRCANCKDKTCQIKRKVTGAGRKKDR